MDIRQLFARLDGIKAWVRDYVHETVARLAYLAPYTMATSDGIEDGIAGRPDEEESQRQARRVQHAGFRSRPLAQSQAVAIAVEGGNTKTVIVAEDDGVSVTLDEGEAAVYSPTTANCIARFLKTGKLTIDSAGVQNIVFNGGNKSVARVDDECKLKSAELGGKMAIWMAQVEAAITALGGTTPTPSVTTFINDPDILIRDGATRVKA